MFLPSEIKHGEFQEVSHGRWFTYANTSDPWAIANGLNHEIDVLDGVRFAKVKKTVVYICVDEDAEGNPVLEKWNIRNHKE